MDKNPPISSITRVKRVPLSIFRSLVLAVVGISLIPATHLEGAIVAVPSGIPLMLRNSFLTARSFPACSAVTANPQSCVSSMPGTVTTLFPASYDVWAGSCSDAVQPAAVNLTNDTGAAVPVAVGLAQVHINTLDLFGTPLIGRALYAVHAAETVAAGAVGCATGASYPLVSSAAGGVDVALPYGTWKLSVSASAASGAGTATVTLTPAGAVPTVTLVTT